MLFQLPCHRLEVAIQAAVWTTTQAKKKSLICFMTHVWTVTLIPELISIMSSHDKSYVPLNVAYV